MSIYRAGADYNPDGPVYEHDDCDFPSQFAIVTAHSRTIFRLTRNNFEELLEAFVQARQEIPIERDFEDGFIKIDETDASDGDDYHVGILHKDTKVEYKLSQQELTEIGDLLKTVHPDYEAASNSNVFSPDL